jgi:hypothetical protein
MNISRKLMALGIAFSVIGSTCAFARPALHSENVRLSSKKRTIQDHAPTAKSSGATGYAGGLPSINAIEGDWQTNMHQE